MNCYLSLNTLAKTIVSNGMSKGQRKSILRHVSDLRCWWWDRAHNVDTCGTIPLANFSFQSTNKDSGLEYSSHHPCIIRSALTSLHIRHEDYTFIDLGCGKGRVLLLASELPFRRIVGVEFAPPLAETARQNLRHYRWHDERCREVKVVTADATEYELPPDPLVLYLANPFFPAAMTQVIENIETSFHRSPRNLVVVFVGLLFRRDSSFGAHAEYQRLVRERYFDVYQHRPPKDAQIPRLGLAA